MNPAIKGLGELALRCNDLPVMTEFYRDIVGLDVYNEDVPGLVFMRMGEGVEGHPQLFALFDRSVVVGPETTTLDHFAFMIDLADYDAERARLEGLGVSVLQREFPYFHWRSLFFADPEGNTVELVAYDASLAE